MNRTTRIALAFATLALSTSALAWIDTGHMVIAAIAEDRLSNKAYKECERLLKIGGTEKTAGFVAGSCWADDTKTKENGPWHYIDLPIRADGKPTKTKPDEENVVWAIKRFSEILKDASKPDAERADALRYLIHFVGDVHQPLHGTTMESDALPNGDRGGNDTKIKADEVFPDMERPPTNLHFFWDMGGGLFMPGAFQRPLNQESLAKIHIQAQTLTARFQTTTPQFKDQIKDLDPMHWAEESMVTARDIVYKVRTGGEIDPSYVQITKTICGQRATLAGCRLAALLNKLLGS